MNLSAERIYDMSVESCCSNVIALTPFQGFSHIIFECEKFQDKIQSIIIKSDKERFIT
jgi:hypothetical protein